MAHRYSYSAVLAQYHDLGWISLSNELCALYGASLIADKSQTPDQSWQHDPRLSVKQGRPWQASRPSNRRTDNWVAIDDSGPDFWSLTDDTPRADSRPAQININPDSEAPRPGHIAAGHSETYSDDASPPSEDSGLDTSQSDGLSPSQTRRETSSTPAASIDQVPEALGPRASPSRDKSLDTYEAMPKTESGPETGRRPGTRLATDIRNAPFMPDRDSASSVATVVPLAPQKARMIEDAPAMQQANTTKPRVSTLNEQLTPGQSYEIGRRRNLQRATEASASEPASKVLPDLPKKSTQRQMAAATSRYTMPPTVKPTKPHQTMPPRARGSSRNRKQRPSNEEESLPSISDSVSETGIEVVDNVALSTDYENGAKIPEHEAAAITRLPPQEPAVPAGSIIPRQASPPPAVGFEATKQIQAQPVLQTGSSSRGGDILQDTFPPGSSYTNEPTFLPIANVVAPGALPESGVQRRANKSPFRGISDSAPVGMPSIQPTLPPQDSVSRSNSTVRTKPPPPVANEKTLAGRDSFVHSLFALSDQDARPRSISEATDASSTAPFPPDILRTRQDSTATVGRDSGIFFRQSRFSEVTKQDGSVGGTSNSSAASTRTIKGSKLLRRLRGISLGGGTG